MKLRVLALLLLIFSTSGQATAQSAGGLQAFLQAADRFDQISVGDGDGAPPHSNDPRLAPIWGDLTDARAIFGDRSFNVADAEVVAQVMQRLRPITSAYWDYGTQGMEPAPRMARRDQNLAAYRDEIIGLWIVRIEAEARFLEILADFYSREGASLSEERRAAMLRSRYDFENSLSGAIGELRDSRLGAANRLAFASALGRNAGRISSVLGGNRRRMLREVAERSRRELEPSAAQALDPLIAALTNAPCTGLCTLS